MDIAEKVKFIQSAMVPMARHTYPYIAGVVAIEDGETGWLVGSALRCSIAGRRAIVTAAHVIHKARAGGRFAIAAARGHGPFELHGAPDHVDLLRDVAIYYLPDEYPAEDVAFWPDDRVDVAEDSLATDYLFVHGFPERRSRFTPLLGGLVSQSFPYGAMLRVEELPPSLEPFQFAMDFDPASMFAPDGGEADWLDPHGLSGSPVWRIGAAGQQVDAWRPELSLLVGVVTTWFPNERLILATKVASLPSLFSR